MEIRTGAIMDGQKEKWVENFARFGIVSKGIVYCLIGVLTAMAAFGMKGQKADKTDTFQVIYEQPFGKFLLIVVALGLVGYVVWRLFQAIRDIDGKGNDSKAKAIRIGYGISALIYISLAFFAFKLAFNGPSGDSGGNSQQSMVSKVLEYPAGEWIIGIAALIFIGNGIRQIYKGASGKFMKNVNVSGSHTDLYKKAGIAGYVSRGIVLVIIGYMFLRAAISSNSSEIQGTKGAFDFLQNTFGTMLMGLVAIGLVGYGIFMFVKARYQKIDLHF